MGEFDWLKDDYTTETARQLKRPLVYARREARRQMINGLKRQALTDLIPELPPPDTDLYVIGNGAGAEIRHGINPQAFDFGSFLPVVVRMLGDQGCTAYVSTWTMARQHSLTMLAMLDDGRLSALTVATDPYFRKREAAICAELVDGLQQRGQRFLCWKNHVKAICISSPDNRYCTITGSANLSAQPRCEQYVLTTAPDVYHFFRDEFFEEMLSHA
jgi:hypothetical protein